MIIQTIIPELQHDAAMTKKCWRRFHLSNYKDDMQ